MCVKAVAWAFKQECPSAAAKLVLVRLAEHADEDGKCWPSQGRIASECGLARETVNRQIRALVSAELLTIERRCNGHGKQANLYFLLCDLSSHRETSDVISRHIPCDLSSHRTVIEPSKEEEKDACAREEPKADDLPIVPEGGFPDATPWFEGKVIFLVKRDCQAWQAEFYAFTDAEFWEQLANIDKAFAAEGMTRQSKWWMRARGWLGKAHRGKLERYPELRDWRSLAAPQTEARIH